ncbi:RHS repeat-associated protein [Arthrobacter sp. GAS37]|uniref:hypothetical protein n=1 Tax=Arthrobacter sp. GAS37 TaxID=3156261 RepID=UPI003832C7C6
MNITVANSTSSGVITAYAGGTPKPGTSNLNYTAGQIIPNFAITAVGADGTISFTNDSPGTVQLIADTMGYFNGPVTGGLPGPHQLQSMTSTPATGSPATSTFSWDAAGRMTGRAGETLNYTPDGKLATTTGTSSLPANPNPSAAAGTPPAPVSGTAGSTGTRYYDAGGNLVGITDGTGTTVTIGSITAHSTPAGVKTATKTYSFAGKAVAQRTAAGGTVKLALIISDGVGTAQTIVQGAVGTTPVIAQTRYTDPLGLARGPTQTATGNGAYSTAGAGVLGMGSNAANPNGYGAVNGYIDGLADTISTLTHLGARDLDPVLGTFTSPDPVLKLDVAKNFSPYVYGEADAINNADSSGLMILGPMLTDGPNESSWHGVDATPGADLNVVRLVNGFRPPAPRARPSGQSFLQAVADRPRPQPAAPQPDPTQSDCIQYHGNCIPNYAKLRVDSYNKGLNDNFGTWKRAETTFGHWSTVTGAGALGTAFIPGVDVASPVLAVTSVSTSFASMLIACTVGSGPITKECGMGFIMTSVGAVSFGYGTYAAKISLNVATMPADLLTSGYGAFTW